MKTYTITTPPPSINAMYRGGRRFLTKAGREAKDTITTEIRIQRNSEPLTGPVALNVLFYLPDKRRKDIDNCLKALLDCMTGVLYLDDSQIEELHVYKLYDAKQPRTVVQVL